MFYILLAITLLAALSFAIAQGGRSGVSSIASEKQRLAATDIMSFSETIANAIAQIRLRGSDIGDIRFSHPDLAALDYGTFNTSPQDEVFNPEGGRIIYSPASAAVTTTTGEDFMFLSDNEITNIGTTAGNSSSADLLMVLRNVKEAVCIEINDMLGVTAGNVAPPTDSDIDVTAKYKGTFGYSETVGNEDANLSGQKEACFLDTSGNIYTYYRVLIVQ